MLKRFTNVRGLIKVMADCQLSVVGLCRGVTLRTYAGTCHIELHGSSDSVFAVGYGRVKGGVQGQDGVVCREAWAAGGPEGGVMLGIPVCIPMGRVYGGKGRGGMEGETRPFIVTGVFCSQDMP